MSRTQIIADYFRAKVAVPMRHSLEHLLVDDVPIRDFSVEVIGVDRSQLILHVTGFSAAETAVLEAGERQDTLVDLERFPSRQQALDAAVVTACLHRVSSFETNSKAVATTIYLLGHSIPGWEPAQSNDNACPGV